jgi:hypothetical protein
MGHKIEKLSNLTDVTGAPTDGQSLTYSTSTTKWSPSTVSGGGGGGGSPIKGYCFYSTTYGGGSGSLARDWGIFGHNSMGGFTTQSLSQFSAFQAAGSTASYSELHKSTNYDATSSGNPTNGVATAGDNIVIAAGSKILVEMDLSGYISDSTAGSELSTQLNVMTHLSSRYHGYQDSTLASQCVIENNTAVYPNMVDTTKRLYLYLEVPSGHANYCLGNVTSITPTWWNASNLNPPNITQNSYNTRGSNYQLNSDKETLLESISKEMQEELLLNNVTIPEGPIIRITQFN